jgi:hypothetical protein
MDENDMQRWRIAMQQQKLPHGSKHYFMARNLCPACKGKSGDCPHCSSEGTYRAYLTNLQNDPLVAYRMATKRIEELVLLCKKSINDKIVAEQANKKLKAELRTLLANIQAEMPQLDGVKNKPSLAKIQEWLLAMQEQVKEE